MGHRAFVFFLLLVSTMKYFSWKPKQWQREPFVLRKEINTAETGKVSRNIWFSQAMGCWITAPKCWTVLRLFKIVLQTIRIVKVCLAQSCKTLVSCSCRLLKSTASGDIQAEPTSSAFNSLSASAIYNIVFVPPLSIFDPRAA